MPYTNTLYPFVNISWMDIRCARGEHYQINETTVTVLALEDSRCGSWMFYNRCFDILRILTVPEYKKSFFNHRRMSSKVGQHIEVFHDFLPHQRAFAHLRGVITSKKRTVTVVLHWCSYYYNIAVFQIPHNIPYIKI